MSNAADRMVLMLVRKQRSYHQESVLDEDGIRPGRWLGSVLQHSWYGHRKDI